MYEQVFSYIYVSSLCLRWVKGQPSGRGCKKRAASMGWMPAVNPGPFKNRMGLKQVFYFSATFKISKGPSGTIAQRAFGPYRSSSSAMALVIFLTGLK